MCIVNLISSSGGKLYEESCRMFCGVYVRHLLLCLQGQPLLRRNPYNIALIIKATDSDFWQYVIVGGTNYGLEHPDVAKVTSYGPLPSEADIDKQVAIVEDVIASQPDAIVIASTSSDATVPALERG